jgi:mannose-6-phosphate isomerase-like protein (cupin superfamily)
MSLPHIANLNTGEWREHVRFPGIYMQTLLDTSDNPLASVNAVRVPPGGVIGRHHHEKQIETIWIIKGNAVLVLDQTEVSLQEGQILAIPIGSEHALRNQSQAIVELLAFFTPPLS